MTNYINPFEEVERGIRSCDLDAYHPYWDNFVKVRKIIECFIEQDKLDFTKYNRYLFEREFSKNITPEEIQSKINHRFSQCYGAMSSLNYVMTRPSGVPLRLESSGTIEPQLPDEVTVYNFENIIDVIMSNQPIWYFQNGSLIKGDAKTFQSMQNTNKNKEKFVC